jgi:hypothetical protein
MYLLLNSPVDTKKFFDPLIFTPYPVDPDLIPIGASGPSPSHSMFFGPQSSFSSSFDPFMASQSTNSSNFLSCNQNPFMAVDEMTLLALFLSGERIADVNYGRYNGSHISMPSPYSQAPPNFMPPTASAQVHHTPSFHRNSGAHPEGYGAYFSSTIVQSPYSFDSDPLLDTGVIMPGTQEDLAGMHHLTFTKIK